MYDIIGDIHGYADELVALLKKLGYSNENGFFAHPANRQAVFVGDLIDKGPKLRKTLAIVKAMTDNNTAIAIMGNHEFNYLQLYAKEFKNSFFSHASPKRIKLLNRTLVEFENNLPEWKTYLEWFRTMPLFLEVGGIRVVHACWDNASIDFLKTQLGGNLLTSGFLKKAAIRGSRACRALDVVLSGIDIDLPEESPHIAADGDIIRDIRIKWWMKTNGQPTYKALAVKDWDLVNVQIPEKVLEQHDIGYHYSEPPVFFGHYWQKGSPELQKNNVCCVDYSVAKGERLVAYCWDGELLLNNNKFVSVESKHSYQAYKKSLDRISIEG